MDIYIDRIFMDALGHTGNTYYYRIIRRGDGMVWDNVALAFSHSTTWADSVIILVEKGTTGQFPVLIPAGFPAATHEVAIYHQAGSNPANTDDVENSYETVVGDIFGF